AKLHGYAAVAALSILVLEASHTALPRGGWFGLIALLLAAAGGVVLNLGYHWKLKPLPEWLVFVHMSIAFIGFLAIGLVTLSLTP
ncbi:MAG: hypothetical protein KGJ30_21585, partial [Burkholderiales bacterium]|nr:hypothetical protein [Burkholderiales bacterium]